MSRDPRAAAADGVMTTPYHHCSRCGAPGLSAVSSREFVCAACQHRHFITPFPAAVALVQDAAGRLLVIRRAHEPGLGLLGLPGGVIEPEETGEAACARETREETGLELPAASFRYLAALPNQYWFQDYLWPTLDLFYAAQLDSTPELAPNPEEVSEILWIPPGKVPLDQFAFASNARAVRLLHPQA